MMFHVEHPLIIHSSSKVLESMNEDTFNMSLRKYLKRVGVTSQRELETAVQQAIADGKLKGDEALGVTVTLKVPGLDLEHVIEGEISLE